MKRRPKQKAADIAYICEQVHKKNKAKNLKLHALDLEIEKLRNEKTEISQQVREEIEVIKSEKCKELNIKLDHINRLLKTE